MDKNEMIRRIREDLDFIKAPKHQNSLKKFLTRMDKPCEDQAIGRLLLLSADEVERLYQESVTILRKEMCDEEENIGQEKLDGNQN